MSSLSADELINRKIKALCLAVMFGGPSAVRGRGLGPFGQKKSTVALTVLFFWWVIIYD